MSDLRMPELNFVMLSGRLTHDPDLRYLPSGTPVCKLRLAVSRTYKTREGEKREDTLFINVSVWSRQGEFLGEVLSKGRPVIVEGRLVGNEWEDQSGQRRSVIEVNAMRVQMLDWDQQGAGGGRPSPRPEAASAEEPAPDDDIPF